MTSNDKSEVIKWLGFCLFMGIVAGSLASIAISVARIAEVLSR
jgi:hypothetical protein